MQPIHLLAPLVGFIIRKGLTVVKFRWLFYNNLKKGMNPNLELLGVLPTMVDARTTLGNQVLEEIKKFFPDKIFSNAIPRNIRLAEAPSHGVPIGVYDRFSKGSRAYKAVAKEVIQRIERGK